MMAEYPNPLQVEQTDERQRPAHERITRRYDNPWRAPEERR